MSESWIIWHLKCLMKKLPVTETLQLLSVTPKSPQIKTGHHDNRTWIVVTLLGKNAYCCTCHQAQVQTVDKQDTWEPTAPFYLDKVKSVSPMFLLHRKTSYLLGLAAKVWCCPGTSAPNTGAWDDGLGNGLVSVIFSWYMGHLDYTSCSNVSFSHLWRHWQLG